MKDILVKLLFIIVFHFILFNAFSQKPVEPGKMKLQNVTVTYDDGTVKTQILNKKKSIKTKTELTYLWFSQMKIMETKGGYDGKLLHGSYRSFYLNNQLKEQGEVKYGLKNKKWTYWYDNGNLKETITWKTGRKNGEYSIFNDLGKLMAKGNFKNDKLNGKFYTYGPDGKVTQEKKYKDGNEVLEMPKPPKEKIVKENQEKILKKKKEEEKKTKKDKKKKSNENSEKIESPKS